MNYQLLIDNNGVFTTWLIGVMTVNILSFTFALDTTFLILHTVEEHPLPATKEKEIYLTNHLIGLKKGSKNLNKYLKTFKFICDNHIVIGKPIDDLDKWFR